MELWQNDGVDSLRSALHAILKKYPNKPEALFLQAVFETDAKKANAIYETILKDHRQNVIADESLFRLIQYDYAVGKYRVAQVRANQLKNEYPASRFLKKAEQMFAGLEQAPVEKAVVTDSDAAVNVSEKKFRLQVGAFGQLKNAEDLRDKLKNAGYTPIEFSEKTVNDKKLILVWVGAFGTKDEAAKTGDVLKNKFQLNYTIVEK
jgi:septal ring-binding cell division protein DamX